MGSSPATSSARVRAPRRLLTWFTESVRGRRGFWAWLGGFLALFLALQVVFLGLTVAAAAVPNDAVVDALSTSAEQGRWDALDFPSDGIGHTTARHAFAGVSDSYTECIALTVGVSNEVDDARNPLLRSLTWPHLGTCSVAYPAIQELAAGQDSANVYTYDRYWIGSAVLTRPLLVLAGAGGVRLAAAGIFILGFVFAAVALARRSSWWTPILLFAPLLLSTNILTQALDSYPHVLSMGVGLLGVALGVRLGREPAPAILAYALIAGGTFNFVDFLLNPPVAWSLFVFGVIVGRLGSGRPRDLGSLGLALGSGALGWLLGYTMTWATRWLLAIVTYGPDAFDEILGMIFTRLGGEYGDLVIPGFTMPTRRNVSFWIDTIPTAPFIAVLCAIAVLVALAILVAQRRRRSLLIVVFAAAPALLIPIWYETLSNHSQIHMWFTYRAVPTGLGIAVAAAWLPIVVRSHRSRRVEEELEGSSPMETETTPQPVAAPVKSITD